MSVKTPRFSGPFKWSKVRAQLLSLREDIQTIKKVAGRNVTVDEHPGKGTIINVQRRAAPAPGTCGNPRINLQDVEINTACYPNGFCDDCIVALHYSDVAYNGERDVTWATPAAEWCGSTPPVGAGCVYQFRQSNATHWQGFHGSEGCGNHQGCDGPVWNESDEENDVYVIKIGGTWYFQSFIRPSVAPSYMMEVFYAEATDISSPVANELTSFSTSCSPYHRDNPFMDMIWGDCTPGSGAYPNILSAGKNGTLLLTP